MDGGKKPNTQTTYRVVTADWSLSMDASKEAKTLRQTQHSKFRQLGPPISLLLIPLTFIALGVFIKNTNGTDKGDPKVASVVIATGVASTVWPIAFAAVLGPLLRTLALFGAQRGIRMGTLEVLLNSQTLVAAFKSPMSVGIFTWWTPILLLAWAWSPVGGQAVLRSLFVQADLEASFHPIITYPTANFTSHGVPLTFRSAFRDPTNTAISSAQDIPTMSSAAFSAAGVSLALSGKSTSGYDQAISDIGGYTLAANSLLRDVWGNVRIPFIDMLPGYHKLAPFDWVNIPSPSDPFASATGFLLPVSSLIGLSVKGMPPLTAGNLSFVAQSSYQTVVGCTQWQDDVENNKIAEAGNYRIIDSFVSNDKTTWLLLGMPKTGAFNPDDGRYPVQEPSNRTTLNITARVTFDGKPSSSKYKQRFCELGTVYVDTKISCSRPTATGQQVCEADSIRRSPDMPLDSNITALSAPAMRKLLQPMSFGLASDNSIMYGRLEQFLLNPPTMFRERPFGNAADLTAIPDDTFRTRLACALNTFIRASYNQTAITGSDGPVAADDVFRGREQRQWGLANGTWTQWSPERYVVDERWAAVYLASATLLLVFAAANVALRSLIRAPDILATAGGLMRDSPYFQGGDGSKPPGCTSGMDGFDATRLVRNKVVRIQDVHPERDVGRIAFSTAFETVPLDRNRKYE